MKFVPMLTAATLMTTTLAEATMPAGFNDQEDKVPAYVNFAQNHLNRP